MTDWYALYDWIVDQLGWWLGLVSAITIAIYGQADIQEPWRHYLSLTGLGASIASAYMLKPRRRTDTRERRTDRPRR